MEGKKLKFGFIGCGRVSRFHADVICALNHDITAVSAREGSLHIDAFAKDYNIKHLYADWRTMAEEQDLDAVILAVSWDETEKLVEGVVKTGLPCLIEKPVALSVKKFEGLYENIKQYSKNILVGYNRRFYEFVPTIRDMLGKEELLSVQLNFPEAANQIIKSSSPGIAEHILFYSTSHCLDLLLFLLGPLKLEWIENKSIDSIHGILKVKENDIPVHLQGDFNTPSNTSITFNFRHTVCQLLPIEKLTVYEGMDVRGPDKEVPIRRFIPKIKSEAYAETKYKPGFLRQMEYFIDVYMNKVKGPDRGCTLEQALEVTRLCEHIKLGKVGALV